MTDGSGVRASEPCFPAYPLRRRELIRAYPRFVVSPLPRAMREDRPTRSTDAHVSNTFVALVSGHLWWNAAARIRSTCAVHARTAQGQWRNGTAGAFLGPAEIYPVPFRATAENERYASQIDYLYSPF